MSELRPITVLLTSSGCPGASTCIRYLQGIKERRVRVVGVDANEESIGRFLADDFRKVPLATDPTYSDALLAYAIEQDVDCIHISSSYEIEILSANRKKFEDKGIAVLASSIEALNVANNKRLLYELFRDDPNVKVPLFTVVNTLEEFISATKTMGYPEKKLCFKPPYSKGSRGFRYLASNISRADLLMNYKPDSKIITLEEMVDIFENEDEFPELLLMEAVEGEEIDSMVLALEGDPLIITHKTREQERGGVIVSGGHCQRLEIDRSIKAILSKIPLTYNFGIQFKGGALMEINPRLSTFIYTESWVEPYFAVKLALGEYSPEDLSALQSQLPMNLRMIRYFDQCFFAPQDLA